MGAIRIVGPSKTRGYPYPVCKKMESMMGFMPRQGNLRLVFRLFCLMRGLPSIRLK